MERFGIECKQLMNQEIEKRLKESPNLFISSFQAMTVPEQEELRNRIKETDGSVFVVKKRIAKRALEKLDLGVLFPLMQELTAISFGGRDSISLSKTLVNFANKHGNFKILGAYIDEQLLDHNSVRQLAAIPSKEVLLAQILAGFKSPIQGLVTSLSATVKKLVVVIDKIKEKK